jgi:sugar lactone lactonase YvrE
VVANSSADEVPGTITTIAGGWNGDGGSATEAVLNDPRGIDFGSDGSLYIVDHRRHCVRRVDPDGIITTVAGTGGPGFFGDGGPAVEAALWWPEDVAVGPDGSFYVADWGNDRVRRVNPHGLITTIAGGEGADEMASPTGLALSPDGTLVVADRVCVRRLEPDGAVSTVSGARSLDSPSAVALGRDGELFIASSGRIFRLDQEGTITLIAGTGEWATSSGDGGPATESALWEPRDVAIGLDGSLYIADCLDDRVRVVSPDGIISTFAGNGHPGFSFDGELAIEAELSPYAVAVGHDGSLYLADGQSRVRRVGSDGAITTVAGTGVSSTGYEGGPATEVALEASDIAVGPDGSIYIAGDYDLCRVNSEGLISPVPSSGWIREPLGLAADSDGSLYVADFADHRVRRCNPDGTITTVAGTGECGFSGDGGPATRAELISPTGIAVGLDGSVYIADAANVGLESGDIDSHRIRRVGPGGTITTVAGAGEGEYSGDGGPATEAHLNDPEAVAIDADGSLYVADTENHRIRRVAPDGIISTVAGIGEAYALGGYSGDGGPAVEAELDSPKGVAIGLDGSLFIADTDNHRVRRVDPEGIITTVAGTGEAGFSGDGGPATEARLKPEDIAVGPDGSLYIADACGRIRRVSV